MEWPSFLSLPAATKHWKFYHTFTWYSALSNISTTFVTVFIMVPYCIVQILQEQGILMKYYIKMRWSAAVALEQQASKSCHTLTNTLRKISRSMKLGPFILTFLQPVVKKRPDCYTVAATELTSKKCKIWLWYFFFGFICVLNCFLYFN